MKKNKDLDKVLATAIISLFVGLAVIPTVNGTIGETVEVTIETIEANEVEEHIVQISGEEEQNLENLIDGFKETLNAAETREESLQIFNGFIDSLDKLDLLPHSMSPMWAQNIVSKNKFCLVAGDVSNAELFGPFSRLFQLRPIRLLLLTLVKNSFSSLNLGGFISFGCTYFDPYYPGPRFSEGWLWNFGLDGINFFDGRITGNAFDIFVGLGCFHVGVSRFSGISIVRGEEQIFFGSALGVDVNCL